MINLMLRIDTLYFGLLMSDIFDQFYAQNSHTLFGTFVEWHSDHFMLRMDTSNCRLLMSGILVKSMLRTDTFYFVLLESGKLINFMLRIDTLYFELLMTGILINFMLILYAQFQKVVSEGVQL